MTIAIVGAGAAGLSLALMLDDDVTLFEQSEPGGLCRSSLVDGFVIDTGPHILGGIPDAVRWVTFNTPGVDWVIGETSNVGFIDGEFVTHPFQDEAIGQQYMAKMWKTDPAELSIGGLNAQAKRKPGGVSHFSYPRRGGYQAITDSWVQQLKGSIVNEHVSFEYPPKGFDHVIWSAPLPGRRYNSLLLVTAGFKGEAPPYTAVYCPTDASGFHRVSFPSKFSVHNAPGGYWSAQGEMSFAGSPDDQHGADFLDLVNRITGTAQTPVMLKTNLVQDAYPVPMNGDIEPESRDWIFHGRTGSHRYLNLDGVVDQSMKLAQKLNGRRGSIPEAIERNAWALEHGVAVTSYGPGDDT